MALERGSVAGIEVAFEVERRCRGGSEELRAVDMRAKAQRAQDRASSVLKRISQNMIQPSADRPQAVVASPGRRA